MEKIRTCDIHEAQAFWEKNKEEFLNVVQNAVLSGQPLVFATLETDEEGIHIVNADASCATIMIDKLIASFPLYEQLYILCKLNARMRYREFAESITHVLKQLGMIREEEGEENE